MFWYSNQPCRLGEWGLAIAPCVGAPGYLWKDQIERPESTFCFWRKSFGLLARRQFWVIDTFIFLSSAELIPNLPAAWLDLFRCKTNVSHQICHLISETPLTSTSTMSMMGSKFTDVLADKLQEQGACKHQISPSVFCSSMRRVFICLHRFDCCRLCFCCQKHIVHLSLSLTASRLNENIKTDLDSRFNWLDFSGQRLKLQVAVAMFNLKSR